MDPIATLPDAHIRPGQPVSDAFLARGITTYRHACLWVKELPYGSNSRVDAPLIVFMEGRGTCFTKHGRSHDLQASSRWTFTRTSDSTA